MSLLTYSTGATLLEKALDKSINASGHRVGFQRELKLSVMLGLIHVRSDDDHMAVGKLIGILARQANFKALMEKHNVVFPLSKSRAALRTITFRSRQCPKGLMSLIPSDKFDSLIVDSSAPPNPTASRTPQQHITPLPAVPPSV
jgi:hypothetical protein